jgi:hypothetical protein
MNVGHRQVILRHNNSTRGSSSQHRLFLRGRLSVLTHCLDQHTCVDWYKPPDAGNLCVEFRLKSKQFLAPYEYPQGPVSHVKFILPRNKFGWLSMAATESPKVPPDVASKPSGAASALRYTGIPPSWFQKRPKLPSRNWLIFWTVLGSLTSLYIYDRREVKKIRQNYVERVHWRAEEKLNPLDLPRKVRVYACRWPGDDDHDRSMKYFRRYVKVRRSISTVYIYIYIVS